ncbi:MAG: helix-turn-helix domain-containing protein [Gammaproteobacteria bacterium]|nr:helix-turn-helix domain-containing protein [Gammaproteobacteria bacterium]
MSFQAVQAVAGAHSIKGATRAVLYVLANYADRGGSNSFPSQARIADESGFSDRTVRRALTWLEEQGIIRRIGGKRRRGSRGRAVVIWRIALALLKTGHRVLSNSASNKPTRTTGLAKRVVRQIVPSDPARRALSRKQEAINALAERVGWLRLMEWGEEGTDAALKAEGFQG